ncbi:hypothetical protein CCR93_06355 [Rhodobium orientis]|nr:hypothetical protein [Rhodobium orientis]
MPLWIFRQPASGFEQAVADLFDFSADSFRIFYYGSNIMIAGLSCTLDALFEAFFDGGRFLRRRMLAIQFGTDKSGRYQFGPVGVNELTQIIKSVQKPVTGTEKLANFYCVIDLSLRDLVGYSFYLLRGCSHLVNRHGRSVVAYFHFDEGVHHASAGEIKPFDDGKRLLVFLVLFVGQSEFLNEFPARLNSQLPPNRSGCQSGSKNGQQSTDDRPQGHDPLAGACAAVFQFAIHHRQNAFWAELSTADESSPIT